MGTHPIFESDFDCLTDLKKMGADQSKQLENTLFNLKFSAKSLVRESKKCEKAEKEEKAKLKKAIQKGNTEGARIYAENAIRNKNQAINFLRLSSRVDAVASRVQTAVSMQRVTKDMTQVVRSMESALKSMNLEQIATMLDRFEKSFENLDVQSQVMEDTVGGVTAQSVPEGDVQQLMMQTADEAGLELDMDLPQAGTTQVATAVPAGEDDLSQRLAAL